MLNLFQLLTKVLRKLYFYVQSQSTFVMHSILLSSWFPFLSPLLGFAVSYLYISQQLNATLIYDLDL